MRTRRNTSSSARLLSARAGSYHSAVETSVHSLDDSQRRYCLGWALWPPVVPDIAFIVDIAVGGRSWLSWSIFGPLLTLISVYFLNIRSGRTTVDAEGIHAHRLLRRWSLTWQQIESVEADLSTRNKPGALKQVIVRSRWRARRLPAPKTWGTMDDPFFEQRYQSIEAAFRLSEARGLTRRTTRQPPPKPRSRQTPSPP
jgi:hypothetical protein